MPLEMKAKCEKCEKPTPANGEAWICSYECTFCSDCADAASEICPNCGGELMPRPRRKLSA